MSVWQLVYQEIRHRKLNFVLSLVSITIAVGCLVGSMTLLKADSLRTKEREAAVAKAGKERQDAIRKIMKGLGFNIHILPKKQNLLEFYTDGKPTETMPESFVNDLANSKLITVSHLLPTIVTKVHWKELDEDVFLIGTRGEVPILERAVKKPLQDQVPQGTIVLGYHLHKHHKLKVDDKVTFLGQELTVTSCYAERGSKDDVTVWMNLKQVQELLGMQNQINAIMALECNCATADRVAEIRAEIEKILPSTQVIEMGGKALARAEARNEAKKSADAALLQAQEHHKLRAQFSAVSVTVVVIGAGAWICFLTLGNVRQRRSEIGILRALGVRSKQILMIFMGKAVIVGLIGGVIGYLGGYVVGLLAVNRFGIGSGDELGAMAFSLETATNIFQLELLVAAVLMAPLLAGLASWVPAVMAARQDPAVILVEE